MLKAITATAICLTLLCCISSKAPVSATDAPRKATATKQAEITPEAEYYIGRAVGARILADYRVYSNDKVTQYINLIGQVLAMSSDMPETFDGYHFLILDSEELNSFSAPGGLVFVTHGLLQLATSEDMVACVLSYSISHVVLHSGVETISLSRWTEGGDAQGDRDEKTGNEVPTRSTIGEQTRNQVLSADAMALLILNRSGYDARVYLELLRLVSKEVGTTITNPRAVFPTWEERIAAVGSELKEMAAYRPSMPIENRITRFKEIMGGIKE
jgi:predicted Zn-dependent protease